jgi:hypothetical protein
MAAQNTLEQVRWQDLKVRSEADIVLEIAQKEGWKDCEVFGRGDMIMEPQESMGWKLIPADQYKDSIPPQAVERLHQVLNAGVRVRGVIIADDERRTEPAPEIPEIAPAPARPRISLSWVRTAVSWTGEALLGLAHLAGSVASWIGKGLLVLTVAVCTIVLLWGVFTLLLSFLAGALIHLWWLIPVGLLLFGMASAGSGTSASTGGGYDYDPQLVVLVDDGEGGTAWVSLYTWYD